MTDRINGFYVALERDIRDDDFESIEQAVRMIKGVIDVEVNVVDIDAHVAEKRANRAWTDRLYQLIDSASKT